MTVKKIIIKVGFQTKKRGLFAQLAPNLDNRNGCIDDLNVLFKDTVYNFEGIYIIYIYITLIKC